MLAASKATLQELRNVHMPHLRAVRARLRPLARFASLQALTLCRVFGNRGDPAMAVVLRQLPTSLGVRKSRPPFSWTRHVLLLSHDGRRPSAGWGLEGAVPCGSLNICISKKQLSGEVGRLT